MGEYRGREEGKGVLKERRVGGVLGKRSVRGVLWERRR